MARTVVTSPKAIHPIDETNLVAASLRCLGNYTYLTRDESIKTFDAPTVTLLVELLERLTDECYHNWYIIAKVCKLMIKIFL